MRRHDPACLRSSNGKITPVDAIREPDPQSAVRLDLMPDGWCRAICSVTLAQKQTAAAPQRGTAQQNSSPVSSAPASTDIKGVRSNCKPVSSPMGAKRCSTIILLYVRNLWTVKEVPRIECVVADIFEDVPVILIGAVCPGTILTSLWFTNPPSALLVVSTNGAPPPTGTTCVMKATCREKFKVTTSAKGRDHVSLSG
jgi:hypothetical protein